MCGEGFGTYEYMAAKGRDRGNVKLFSLSSASIFRFSPFSSFSVTFTFRPLGIFHYYY